MLKILLRKKTEVSIILFLVAALLIAILAVIFALQNPAPVTVTFLNWKFESSLALMLLLTFALGLLLGLVARISAVIRKGWTISSQRKKIAQLEKTLQEKSKTSETVDIKKPETS